MRDTARTDMPRSLHPGETRPTIGDGARQAIVLLLALGQVAAPPLLFPDGFQVATPRPGPEPAPTPLAPAGYAFIIWTPIFLGSLAYAVLQARRRAAMEPLYRAIGWRTAIGFGASIAWLVFARFGPLWATIPLIVVMWAALGSALVSACGLAMDSPAVAVSATSPRLVRLLVLLPLALYAGWLSVAIFANTAEVLRGYGFAFFGVDLVVWSVIALLLAGAGAIALLVRARYTPGYTAAVVWALIGIGVANVDRGASSLVALIALALAAVLTGVTVVGRRSRHARAV